MLLIQCKGCRKTAFTQDHQNPNAYLACGCCEQDHDHDAAANACPGGHDGAQCPEGASCLVLTPEGEDCPGGHCGKGVDGCTVCRPIIITVPPGSGPVLTPAGPAAEAISAARGF